MKETYMEYNKFKNVVEKTLDELVKSDEFLNVARLNWKDNQGNEEVLYPFFNELLRARVDCQIVGIGYGKVKNTTKKVDCLCYPIDIALPFGIELKGPSYSIPWVSNGLKEDLTKLRTLVQGGHLSYGVAVGIYLLESSSSYVHSITLDSKTIYIDIELEDTH